MLNGETVLSGAPQTCQDCGIQVHLDVYLSQSGWYVGTVCKCGPYSRESGYFSTANAALATLANMPGCARTNQFHDDL